MTTDKKLDQPPHLPAQYHKKKRGGKSGEVLVEVLRGGLRIKQGEHVGDTVHQIGVIIPDDMLELACTL